MIFPLPVFSRMLFVYPTGIVDLITIIASGLYSITRLITVSTADVSKKFFLAVIICRNRNNNKISVRVSFLCVKGCCKIKHFFDKIPFDIIILYRDFLLFIISTFSEQYQPHKPYYFVQAKQPMTTRHILFLLQLFSFYHLLFAVKFLIPLGKASQTVTKTCFST